MNERIQELAERAGLTTVADVYLMKKYMPNEVKFAELIVQECAKLFVDQKYMILNPNEPFANERVRVLKEHDKDTFRKIKGHFGVK
jgi:hypothetical protein